MCDRMSTEKANTHKTPPADDPDVAMLLGKITAGKQESSFRKDKKIFSQGDAADSVYFIQTGRGAELYA
jgi:CRP-like cAMP-binding protein